MENKSLISLLEEMNVLCRDNGKRFDEDSPRIDVIKKKVSDTDYQLEEGRLSLLYYKEAAKKHKDDILLISSHIDCKQPEITQCFSEHLSNGMLHGTHCEMLQPVSSDFWRNAL